MNTEQMLYMCRYTHKREKYHAEKVGYWITNREKMNTEQVSNVIQVYTNKRDKYHAEKVGYLSIDVSALAVANTGSWPRRAALVVSISGVAASLLQKPIGHQTSSWWRKH